MYDFPKPGKVGTFEMRVFSSAQTRTYSKHGQTTFPPFECNGTPIAEKQHALFSAWTPERRRLSVQFTRGVLPARRVPALLSVLVLTKLHVEIKAVPGSAVLRLRAQVGTRHIHEK